MAIPGALPTQAPAVVSHPHLLPFHTVREATYTTLEKLLHEVLTTLSQSTADIKRFQVDVRSRGHVLQEGTLYPMPTLEALVQERAGNIKKYAGFTEILGTTTYSGREIQRMMGIFAPLPSISWIAEDPLKAQAPDFHEQTKPSEERCASCFAKLQERFGHFGTLRCTFEAEVNHKDLSWAMARFSDIVDNGGKPLPSTSRIFNYWTGSFRSPGALPPGGAEIKMSPTETPSDKQKEDEVKVAESLVPKNETPEEAKTQVAQLPIPNNATPTPSETPEEPKAQVAQLATPNNAMPTPSETPEEAKAQVAQLAAPNNEIPAPSEKVEDAKVQIAQSPIPDNEMPAPSEKTEKVVDALPNKGTQAAAVSQPQIRNRKNNRNGTS